MNLAAFRACMKLHIPDGLPSRKTFYESDSLAWVDPDSQIESGSAYNFFTGPAADELKRRIDVDVATVPGARYRERHRTMLEGFVELLFRFFTRLLCRLAFRDVCRHAEHPLGFAIGVVGKLSSRGNPTHASIRSNDSEFGRVRCAVSFSAGNCLYD